MSRLRLKMAVCAALFAFVFYSMARADDDRPLAKPRHFVFLVHGIGGNPGSFGYMKVALTNQLNEGNPRYQWLVTAIEYKNQSDLKDAYVLESDLDARMDDFISQHKGLQPGDLISIVAHSQGGIVSLVWMFKSFAHRSSGPDSKISRLRNYISLGTPFWGSRAAELAMDVKDLGINVSQKVLKVLGYKDLNLLSNFGYKELYELGFCSQTTYLSRLALTDQKYPWMLERIKSQVRLYNIGAILNKALEWNLPEWIRHIDANFETDFSTNVPAAQFDFIFARSLKENYLDGDVLQASAFAETSMGTFKIVNAVHAPPNPEKVPGIANIPSACALDANCGSMSYQYIKSILFERPLLDDSALKRKLTMFLLDIVIHLPKGSQIAAHDVNIGFSTKDILVAPVQDAYADDKCDFMPGLKRLYYFGYVANTFIEPKLQKNGIPFATRRLDFEISAPGMKHRFVSAKVRPTYSTFVEVNLEPR